MARHVHRGYVDSLNYTLSRLRWPGTEELESKSSPPRRRVLSIIAGFLKHCRSGTGLSILIPVICADHESTTHADDASSSNLQLPKRPLTQRRLTSSACFVVSRRTARHKCEAHFEKPKGTVIDAHALALIGAPGIKTRRVEPSPDLISEGNQVPCRNLTLPS